MIRNLFFVLSLFPLASTFAATYTVGPSGTHATIQAAIDAALVAPGTDEIRVATGTFVETLNFTPVGSGNVVDISGGWVNTFTTQSATPSIVDGGMAGRVFDVAMGAGDGLMLHNLRIQNGLDIWAAGLLITQDGDSVMEISECEIINNTAQDARAYAGGMRVSVNENSQLTLVDSLVSNNAAICSDTIDCSEGGIGLQAADSAMVTISRNEISNNSVSMTEGSAFSGGARLAANDTSTLVFDDNHVFGNSVTGSSPNAVGVGVNLSGDGTMFARRNRIENNVANIPVPNAIPQIAFFQRGDNTGVLSDTVVVNGNGQGLRLGISGVGTATIHAVNLTIAEHAFTGIQATNTAAGGSVTVSNTISVDNETNSSFIGDVDSTTNLFTGDAMFTNAGAGDYSLAPGSPAIDAGTNAPPGGLGPTDIDGNARIAGGTVDIGAHESVPDGFFGDGFETP